MVIILYLHWPEGGDQYGGEVKIGPGHEEIAEGRIDENNNNYRQEHRPTASTTKFDAIKFRVLHMVK